MRSLRRCPHDEVLTATFNAEYNNDPVKTAEAMNKLGFATLGDIGYLDEEGYLFLTDRKAFMIISGGVNICEPLLHGIQPRRG